MSKPDGIQMEDKPVRSGFKRELRAQRRTRPGSGAGPRAPGGRGGRGGVEGRGGAHPPASVHGFTARGLAGVAHLPPDEREVIESVRP